MPRPKTTAQINLLSNAELRFSAKVSGEMFGVDMLRFRNTDAFRASAVELGASGVRWPGEILLDPAYGLSTSAEDNRWINAFNPDGTVAEYAFDLKHPNVIDTTGFPREGLKEALAFAVANDVSFTMLIPEDRYVKVDRNATDTTNVFSLDLDSAFQDIDIFLGRLFAGQFGEVPNNFTLQIGQEYYTGQLQFLTEHFELDHDARTAALGQLYDALATRIADRTAELTQTGNNPNGIDPEVAVHMGRLFGDYGNGNSSKYSGSLDDAIAFAEQFTTAGLESLDKLLIQRYVRTWDAIDDGLSVDIREHTIADIERIWETFAASKGLENKEFDIVAGWAMNSVTREEIRKIYDGDVSDQQLRERSDRAFESFVQNVWAKDGVFENQHSAHVLQFFTELVGAGVDEGTYYGVDLANPGQLSAATVDGDVVTFTAGSLFQSMAEVLPGATLHRNFVANDISDSGDPNKEPVNINVFESETQVIAYVWVNDIGDEGLVVDLDFGPEVIMDVSFGSATETAFRSKELEGWQELFGIKNLDEKWGAGFQDTESTMFAIAETDASGNLPSKTYDAFQGISLEFVQDYEVIQIVIDKDQTYSADTSFASTAVSLQGTSSGEKMLGSRMDDFIRGRGGDDFIISHSGNDEVYGDAGDDIIYDTSGDNLISGGMGNDRIYLVSGDNYVSGGGGDDRIETGTGNDILFGNNGEDFIYGYLGDDALVGGGGNDHLSGGLGDDTLSGSRGNDALFGGAGDDYLIGGEGADNLFGGGGADTFLFRHGDGGDRINDFDVTEGDKIDLTAMNIQVSFEDFVAQSATQRGADLEIIVGTGQGILIEQTNLASISSDWLVL